MSSPFFLLEIQLLNVLTVRDVHTVVSAFIIEWAHNLYIIYVVPDILLIQWVYNDKFGPEYEILIGPLKV